jgi:hypothetical protein
VVFVVNEGRAEQRTVRLGFESEGHVQILAGLEAGDSLVTAGMEKLRSGAEIRLPQQERGLLTKELENHAPRELATMSRKSTCATSPRSKTAMRRCASSPVWTAIRASN